MFKIHKMLASKLKNAAHDVLLNFVIVVLLVIPFPAYSAGSEELKVAADAVASEVDDFISPIVEQVQQLNDEELINIFSMEADAMQAEADSMLGNFSGALKLRFFKPGKYDLDRDAKPPLGFASVALLRSLEKSDNDIAVEYHLANSPDKHMVIVRKVSDADGNLAGLVHLSLDPAPLLKILEQQDSTDTYFELSQPVGNKVVALVTGGDDSLRIGKPVTVNVPGTHLQIDIWNGEGEPLPSRNAATASTADAPVESGGMFGVSMLAGIAAVLVIVVGGLLFVIKKRKKDDGAPITESDDVDYGGAVLAIMEGAHPGVEKLVPNLPGLGQSKTIKPISQGLIDDDVTVVEKPPATPVASTGNAQPAVKPAAESVPPVKKTEHAQAEPATTSEIPDENDMSMEMEKPPVKSEATPEEMSMDFDMPGVEQAPPVEKEKPEQAEEKAETEESDMSLEFEMPGAETKADEKKTDETSDEVATEEELMMEFEMPGAEQTPSAEKAEQPEEKTEPGEGDMSMEFEMPGTEETPPPEKTAEPEDTDTGLELDLPGSETEEIIDDPLAGQAAETESGEQAVDEPEALEIPVDHTPVDTEAPPDLSMEFELPGTEDTATPDETAEQELDLGLELDLPAAEDTTDTEISPEEETQPNLGLELELPEVDDASEPGTSEHAAPELGMEPDLSLDIEQPETTPEKKSPEIITDTSVETAGKKPASTEKAELSSVIFRAYDIRGIVGKTLTASIVQQIGQAIGSEAEARGQKTVVVGRDGRTSSLELAEALTRGLRASGRDVIDIGMIPTPVLYFATHHLETGSGVMVTGSHNGPAYNGLKIMLAGETLASDAIQALYRRVKEKDMVSGKGGFKSEKVIDDYIKRVSEDVPVTLGGALKIVIDCGNGVAGLLAPRLFQTLGHEIIELYCDVDGKFPNHHPDPSQPENLQDLVTRIKQEHADLGLAFDGDGDRLGVVDGEGNIIWPDRQMMVLARDVASRHQGSPIIFDVKCSHHLKEIIEENGGKPMMWKTGHSLIKAKMKEVDAPLAGEMSGHIFFKERWYGFDDAMYAGARLVEILTATNKKPSEVFAELPGDVTTPEIRISLKEKHHEKFMKMLKKKIKFEDGELIDIDGIRVDFPYGWGLIRPSNTSPFLIARFEAENEDKLKMIQKKFHDVIKTVAPDLKLPF